MNHYKTWTYLAVLLLLASPMSAQTIDGDCVYVDNTDLYAKVCPHTISDPTGEIDIWLTSKQYGGLVDVAFGSNENMTFTKGEIEIPYSEVVEHSYTCEHQFNYTLDPNYFWCYDVLNYTDPVTNITDSWSQIFFEHSFDHGNIPAKTAYWNETVHHQYRKLPVDGKYNVDYLGSDTWYTLESRNINQGQEYHAVIDYTAKLNSHGKYSLCIKPDGESIGGANTYCLDPWWNNSYMFVRDVNITERSGTTQTDYQANFTMDTASLISAGKMESDCRDLEIVNTSNEIQPRYVEYCNTANSMVWFKANRLEGGAVTTFYAYYNNTGLSARNHTADGVATFIDWFDCDDGERGWVDITGDTTCSNDIIRVTASATGWDHTWRSSTQYNSGTMLRYDYRQDGDEFNTGSGMYIDTSIAVNENDGYHTNRETNPGDEFRINYNGGSPSYTNIGSQTTANQQFLMTLNGTHFYFDIEGEGGGGHASTRTTYYMGAVAGKEYDVTYAYFDNVSVQKYIYPIPTSAVGNEVEAPSDPVYVPGIKNWKVNGSDSITVYRGDIVEVTAEVNETTYPLDQFWVDVNNEGGTLNVNQTQAVNGTNSLLWFTSDTPAITYQNNVWPIVNDTQSGKNESSHDDELYVYLIEPVDFSGQTPADGLRIPKYNPDIHYDPVTVPTIDMNHAFSVTVDANTSLRSFTIDNITFRVYISGSDDPIYSNTTVPATDPITLTQYWNNATAGTYLYLWEACYPVQYGDITICKQTDNRTVYVEDNIPHTYNHILPVNGSKKYMPETFKCGIANYTDGLVNTSLMLWNSSGDLYTTYTNTSYETGDQSDVWVNLNNPYDVYDWWKYDEGYTVREFPSVDLPAGNYTWRCEACDQDGNCSTSAITQISNFTVEAVILSSITGSGACLTNEGYSFNFTTICDGGGLDPDYALIDLAVINWTHLCRDTDCGNVWSDTNTLYKNGTYRLVADVTSPSECNGTIYVAGFNQNFGYVETPTAPTASVTIDGDLEKSGNAYWITFKNEANMTTLNVSTSTSMECTIICDNYSPDTLDLKDIGYDEILLTTKEQPLFEVIYDGLITRKYESYLGDENFSMYFPANTTDMVTLDFVLEDYTGDFSGSYLQIVRNINTTLETVWQQQWYHLTIPDVMLENDTYYQYKVYTPTAVRVIVWDEIDGSDSTKTISIREPLYGDEISWKTNVNMGFTSDYDASSVGVAWDLDTSAGTLQSIELNVYRYNSTSTQYENIYSGSQSSGQSGSITYVVPDQNETYYLTSVLKCTGEGSSGMAQLINPSKYESGRFPYYGSWGLPDTIANVSKDRIYTGASILLITVVAFGFGSTGLGTGGLVLAAVIGITKWFGWFREMSWAVVYFFIAMSIAYKLVEGRRRIE